MIKFPLLIPIVGKRWAAEYAVATAVIGGGLASAGASVIGSSNAANAQESAASQNNALLQQQYSQNQQNLAPYRDLGNSAGQQLQANDFYTAPITMDEATLQQTPGYQFNQTQGLKATQNAAAARGLAGSGAALKGAATYATGLADSTYQNQFNNANINQTNAYNRLAGILNTGENAAAQTGALNNQTTTAQVNNNTGAANAQAASSNAIGSAVGNAANNIGGYYAYNGLYGGGSNNGMNTTNNSSLWSGNLFGS